MTQFCPTCEYAGVCDRSCGYCGAEFNAVVDYQKEKGRGRGNGEVVLEKVRFDSTNRSLV